ncbi:hypothetical protein G7Z17_g3532 [Cylindrodendrum hubeiense]|uniref:UBC core domain-containing protein n=1 Tax=Cylindrodendrum hubeiense TaxID=595255 RepID=A0A9P5LAN8_9HYPO|nr:hypothetical protein G7Z17_g3532 [Cylindrodendrum hubeiense]
MGEMALSDVGLTDLFKTTLETWDIADAGRGYAQDFNFLREGLDSQRAMFLIWAERMGFESSRGYNKELDRELMVVPVKNNLSHLKLLFSNTDKLSDNYGLKVYQETFVAGAIGQVGAMLTYLVTGKDRNQAAFRRRYVKFLQNFDAQHQKVPPLDATRTTNQQQQKETSIWRVSKWAIEDETKFKQLVHDVGRVVQDLKDLTKHIKTPRSTEEMAVEFVGEINEIDLAMVELVAADNAAILSGAASIRLRAIESRTTHDHNLRSGAPTCGTAMTRNAHIEPSRERNGLSPTEFIPMNVKDIADENAAACAALVKRLETEDPKIFNRSFKQWRMIRPLKEVRDVSTCDKDPWFTFKPIFEDQLDKFIGTFQGPKDTPYEGGIFHVRVNLDEGYPMEPPSMWFLTKILHPNINEVGAISLDLLESEWKPTYSISSLLVAVASLTGSPNWDSPLSTSPAVPFSNDHHAFEIEATRWTKLYATGHIFNPGERSDGFSNTTDQAITRRGKK